MKHLEGVVKCHMEEWLTYGHWARERAEMWQVTASVWLDRNWYPVMATLAALLLVLLQCAARSGSTAIVSNDLTIDLCMIGY